MVGGTATALYIGHRYSIDFDLFTSKIVYPHKIKEKLFKKGFKIQKTLFNEEGQCHLIINNVKITFYSYPYKIDAINSLNGLIKIPDLLTLAGMKALAISERAKWKDYVDLYFIIQKYFSIKDIIKKTNELFGDVYNDKMFYEQLVYFDDISFDEKIDYLVKEPTVKTIKKFFINLVMNNL